MKFLRTAELKLSALRLRGGWERDIDVSNVRRLADELESGAVLPPIRCDENKAIIYGYHRYAAHKFAGRTTITAEIVSVEAPDEAEAAALAENLIRRTVDGDARAKCTARLTEIHAARLAVAAAPALSEVPSHNTPRQAGRPKEPATVAREQVAAQLGITERAVRSLVNRAKAEPQPPTPAAPPCIDLHGHECAQSVLNGAERGQAFCDAIDAATRKLVALCNAFEAEAAAVDAVAVDVQSIRLGTKSTGSYVRANRPAHLCPYCTAREPNCAGCHGAGYVSDEAYQRAPSEMRAGAKPPHVSKSRDRRVQVQEAAEADGPEPAEDTQ